MQLHPPGFSKKRGIHSVNRRGSSAARRACWSVCRCSRVYCPSGRTRKRRQCATPFHASRQRRRARHERRRAGSVLADQAWCSHHCLDAGRRGPSGQRAGRPRGQALDRARLEVRRLGGGRRLWSLARRRAVSHRGQARWQDDRKGAGARRVDRQTASCASCKPPGRSRSRCAREFARVTWTTCCLTVGPSDRRTAEQNPYNAYKALFGVEDGTASEQELVKQRRGRRQRFHPRRARYTVAK